MESQNPSNLPGPARPAENRYLHIAGGFAVGGAFTRIGPNKDVNIPISTVASVELPMVGGRSAVTAAKVSLDCSGGKFGPLPKDVLARLRQIQLLSIGSAKTTCYSAMPVPGEPPQSFVNVEVKGVRIEGGFRIQSALLNLRSEHPRGQRFPNVTIGPASVVGLKLGKLNVTVEFDLESFNRFPTLEAFEPALLRSDRKINARVARSFLRRTDGSLYRNEAGYAIGSIVKNIAGVPKEWIEEDGYTINWPGFGKVMLGEVLVGGYVRRVTLVRLKHCDIEIGGGCDGGSTWP